MGIKLNTVSGMYAKRVMPLIALLYSLFEREEHVIRNALKDIVHLIHYGKVRNVYLYDATGRIEVSNSLLNDVVALELICSEDKTVVCDSTVILRFPDIGTVLKNESYLAKDIDAFNEKYADYL